MNPFLYSEEQGQRGAPPVWLLSVDLQTKTATFTSGMGEAAESARSAFGDIKNSAREMGNDVSGSVRGMGGHMTEARHGVMMLGEEFGVHLPRGITMFVSSLGPVAAVMEAAFPFLAIILGAKLLMEHLEKIHDAANKFAEAFGKSLAATADKNDQLRASVAESKVQLDELLGKPTSGDALTLEIAKARVEANKLAENLQTDVDGVIKLLDTAAHGGIMTALMGTSGAGQAADVMKGFRDAIAKIPHDSHFAENLVVEAQKAGDRAGYELQKNLDKKDRSKATKEHPFEATADFTKANDSLRDVQAKLSEIKDQYNLIGQNDAIKKQTEDTRELQSAEEIAFDAANRHQLEMNGWKLKGSKDQADIANAMRQAEAQEAALREQLTRDGQTQITALISS
jgi:hypothetical protein